MPFKIKDSTLTSVGEIKMADGTIKNLGNEIDRQRVEDALASASALVSKLCSEDVAKCVAEELRYVQAAFDAFYDEQEKLGFNAGRRAGIEAAAELVDHNQIVDTSGGQTVEPRLEGNRAGLAYAKAIRALA